MAKTGVTSASDVDVFVISDVTLGWVSTRGADAWPASGAGASNDTTIPSVRVLQETSRRSLMSDLRSPLKTGFGWDQRHPTPIDAPVAG